MADDDVDHDLLEFMRAHMAGKCHESIVSSSLGVLESAERIYDSALDVSISRDGCQAAAEKIHKSMELQPYDTSTWSTHMLHPKSMSLEAVDWIFLVDLLNFSFFSDETDPEKQFYVSYQGENFSGYWGLCAAVNRALDAEIPITSPRFWIEADDDMLRDVFRGDGVEPMPLLEERIACLREAGEILCKDWDETFLTMLEDANHSAIQLINLLVTTIPSFNDVAPPLPGTSKPLKFYKRAQILVADLWACFCNTSYGYFTDIDKLSMFADYRIPQILHSLGCLRYSPALISLLDSGTHLPAGERLEVEIRGCSIWCIELLRREIRNEWGRDINAILIDFWLWDEAQKLKKVAGGFNVSFHRTRGIYY